MDENLKKNKKDIELRKYRDNRIITEKLKVNK